MSKHVIFFLLIFINIYTGIDAIMTFLCRYPKHFDHLIHPILLSFLPPTPADSLLLANTSPSYFSVFQRIT